MVPAGPAEQPGGQLPRAPERDDARDRLADVAPVRAQACHRLARICAPRRLVAPARLDRHRVEPRRLRRTQRPRRKTLRPLAR